MNHVCQEIAAYTRACERLLSREEALTEDERSLLEYYVKELSREFLSDKPMVRRGDAETASIQRASAI
jgi:hypothetical protein